jgi:hypothetical protein
MTKRLAVSDRRAVDLLLDRSTDAATGDGGGNGSYVSHAQAATEPGIQAVQRVLSLLDMLPAEDPPADLVARTMARLEPRGGAQPMHPAGAGVMTDRPHA